MHNLIQKLGAVCSSFQGEHDPYRIALHMLSTTRDQQGEGDVGQLWSCSQWTFTARKAMSNVTVLHADFSFNLTRECSL